MTITRDVTGRTERRRGATRAARPASPTLETRGGRLTVLSEEDCARIHEASLALLADLGLAEAPPVVVKMVRAAGGRMHDGRLLFPPDLCEAALTGLRRDLTLAARDPAHDLPLTGGAVHLGSGGAAPLVLDMDTGRYRPSTLADLYDAARLVDRLA
ncbi:MAG: trimethylamine methyltransferase family protein, partial [Rhodobacteraceae bacterium]|nr:trimethylamine methyltransferase family protein [Paracoccaceae bacterium]